MKFIGKSRQRTQVGTRPEVGVLTLLLAGNEFISSSTVSTTSLILLILIAHEIDPVELVSPQRAILSGITMFKACPCELWRWQSTFWYFRENKKAGGIEWGSNLRCRWSWTTVLDLRRVISGPSVDLDLINRTERVKVIIGPPLPIPFHLHRHVKDR